MKFLEHQSKSILSQFGLEFTQPVVVATATAAAAAVSRLNAKAVLKAQVPVGGRGKAGAVKIVESVTTAETAAGELLVMQLGTQPVREVSVEPFVPIEREFYVGVTWDLAAKRPIALLSTSGGIHVEQEAAGSFATRHLDPSAGLAPYQGRQMAHEIGLCGRVLAQVGATISRLSHAFVALDAVTAEINPLVIDPDDHLIGLDARLEIDDDARYRQTKTVERFGHAGTGAGDRPPTPLETEAERIDAMDHRGVAGRLVEFDGNLGLLIGGGGASLTVFDAVLRHGGRPANYCEIGGNPTAEKIAALTTLLFSKKGIKKLGVIMNVVNNTRADVIAEGVVAGIRAAGLEPKEAIAVFRVPGSWEPEAQKIMAAAGVAAQGREVSLDGAARLAVEASVADAA